MSCIAGPVNYPQAYSLLTVDVWLVQRCLLKFHTAYQYYIIVDVVDISANSKAARHCRKMV